MPRRDYDLKIDDEKDLEILVQALNSSIRRRILCFLRSSSCSIITLAKKLKLPISTTSFHVNILKNAGLISVSVKRHSRGNEKLVARIVDRFSVDFVTVPDNKKRQSFSQEIPLGSFSDAKVETSCGMASEKGIILADDIPGVFYSPERAKAQIIWFAKGYIEYRIPNYIFRDRDVESISLSLEICSEAPNFNNDWKSDITFWINGFEIATYLSPGDFGDRRGRLNPSWWSDYSSQYGIIKNLKLTPNGVFLDEMAVSFKNIEDLKVKEGDYFTFRIGIKDDAKNQGGLNIFGEKFGDYMQGILYSVDFI